MRNEKNKNYNSGGKKNSQLGNSSVSMNEDGEGDESDDEGDEGGDGVGVGHGNSDDENIVKGKAKEKGVDKKER